MDRGPVTGYSQGEEIANAVTHGIGCILSIIGLVLLIIFSSRNGDALLIVSSAIYGSGLVLLYAFSTIYHSIPQEKARKVLKVLDHSAIFYLIAATYTPFTLVVLGGALGWVIFGIVWGGFVLGTLFKVFLAGRFKWLSISIYIALGWCVVLGIRPLIRSLAYEGFLLLLAGGIVYSIGALIYARKGIRYSHPVWHLFVMMGSFLHFLSVFFYVVQG